MNRKRIISLRGLWFFILALAAGSAPDMASARPWYNANYDAYAFTPTSSLLPFNANNDGELDMIMSSGIMVLGLSNGDFVAGVGFTPPSQSTDMALGDQNGDGRLDVFLATTNAGGPFYLYVYRKLAGDGFSSAGSWVLPEHPEVVHSGDFDGNGLADALVFTQGFDFPDVPDTGAVYFSYPGGTSPGVVFEIPMRYQYDSAVADFDEDGSTDVVVASTFSGQPTSLAFYLSSAGGVLAAPRIDTLLTIFPGVLDVAEVNHDGHMDIVFSDGRAPSSFLGNGDGTFHMIPLPDVGPTEWCGDLNFGDINLDGNLDVVSDCTFNKVYIGLGDGEGRFPSISTHWFPRGGNDHRLIINDFDHDGFGDIVGTRTPGIAILRGNAAGTFNTVPEFPAAPNLSEVVALDWDEDGIEDLVGVNRSNGSLAIFRNRLGSLEAPVLLNLGFVPAGIRFVDLDGDGDRDIVAADNNVDLVDVLLADGIGGFEGVVSYAVGVDPGDVAAGDFDGDDALDLVVANRGFPTWNASYLRGIGDGTFAAGVMIPTFSAPNSVDTGDFNEDGRLDFVTGHTFDKCSLLLGRGDGTFDPYIGVGTTNHPTMTPVRAIDLNKDGHLDLVGKRANGAGIRYGTGSGTFGSVVNYTGGGDGTNLNIRDVDQDGNFDLVSSAGPSLASTRFGTALGTLAYYGVEMDILWVIPFAFDAGPSVELAVLVSGGPRFMILSHPDPISGIPDLEARDHAPPFAIAVNPARGVARFRMT
ncbi:MAG: hypothetical protein FD129_254, partial [bacterium]